MNMEILALNSSRPHERKCLQDAKKLIRHSGIDAATTQQIQRLADFIYITDRHSFTKAEILELIQLPKN